MACKICVGPIDRFNKADLWAAKDEQSRLNEMGVYGNKFDGVKVGLRMKTCKLRRQVTNATTEAKIPRHLFTQLENVCKKKRGFPSVLTLYDGRLVSLLNSSIGSTLRTTSQFNTFLSFQLYRMKRNIRSIFSFCIPCQCTSHSGQPVIVRHRDV